MHKKLKLRGITTLTLTALTAATTFISSCKKDDMVPEHSNIATLSTEINTSINAAGTVSCEQWANVNGNNVSDIPVNTTASSVTALSSLETTSDYTANYGRRIRGYITAPASGSYTFAIAADDAAELWLSTSSDPSQKVKIAGTLSWTAFRQFDKYPSQKSAGISLQSGQKYYIEVLQKQGGGDSHLSVQWTMPDNSVECPISGSHLSPFAQGGVLAELWSNVNGNDVSQIPVGTTPGTTGTLAALETISDYTANYGGRMRGYITAPVTGGYTFAISGDDAAELWLSASSDPAQKVKIASLLSWTGFHDFTKFSSQKSASISLQAGQKYYVEVLHKQGNGDGHVSVQWTLPSGAIECPVPGYRLTPFDPSSAGSAVVTIPSPYTVSNVIALDGAHDITISGKGIAAGSVPAISLKNCYNIHITNCKLYNSTDVGIYLYNCKNITVDYNYFTNVSTGVYADHSSEGGIIINNNQFFNMMGPFPRGQFVQFNNVNGANNSINYNKGENILGSSYPEDAINVYQSSGTASSPITVNGNWIRGGGPSNSGGGIMLGDQGGSYATASSNILLNPGQYGMAIAGGDHNQLINNTILGSSQYFTNVGLYVNSIGGYNATNSTVSGNKVRFYNATNYQNNVWLAPGVAKPTGWDTDNTWGASLDSSILPSVLITYQ